MNEETQAKLIGVSMIVILLGLIIGMMFLLAYATYQNDSFSTQIDVVQHLTSSTVQTVSKVPHGQTIAYYFAQGGSDDQFKTWIQALQQNNITTIYYVPKGNYGLTYQGAVLYFEIKDVIYLYQ